MTSTRSYSDNGCGRRTSLALVRENLRRYWTIPFVAGLGYFLVMVLPILLHYRNFQMVAPYVENTLLGENVIVLILDVTLAVVVAVTLLGYLHRSAACISLHSMPARRGQLMGASMISGGILLVLPLLAGALLMLACRGATAVPVSPEDASAMMSDSALLKKNAADLITLAACGKWLAKTLVVCGYTFVVTCLAGVLAGRRTIHVLTALFFNALPGIAILLSYAYMTTFLEGFPSENRMMELLERTSPVAYSMGQSPLWGSVALGYGSFVLAGVVIAALTLWIYRRVPLEREGDATVFPLMGDLLCLAVSFVCMSGFAFLASMLSETKDFNRTFLLYAACAGVVSFLVFRMVADSSTHIFHLRNLGKFAVFVGLTALVFAFTVFDVQGYGRVMPETADVARVAVTQEDLFSRPAVFTEPSQVERILTLHKAVLNDTPAEEESLIDNVTLSYTLKNGKRITREYVMGNKALAVLEPLRRTKPFLQAQQYRLTGEGSVLKVDGKYPELELDELYGPDEQELDEGDTLTVRKKDIPAVIRALNQDMAGMEFRYLLRQESERERCTLRVNLYEDAALSEGDWNGRHFCIDSHWPSTRKVLKALGYLR